MEDSVSSSEGSLCPCLYFKEVRDTCIYTIEKGIHVYLFKADYPHAVLLKRLGYTGSSALVLFTLPPTHPLHATLTEKNYINLFLLASNDPGPHRFLAWECYSH